MRRGGLNLMDRFSGRLKGAGYLFLSILLQHIWLGLLLGKIKAAVQGMQPMSTRYFPKS